MPSVPSNPEPHPPLWMCLCSYRGFHHQLPQAWHFLSSASSDPPLFPHLSRVPVGRKGAGPGIRVSTQWLAQSSEVRKRERKRERAFNSFHCHLSGENSSELFCANMGPRQILHWKTDRDQLNQRREEIMCADTNQGMLTFRRLLSWSPSTPMEEAALDGRGRTRPREELGPHPSKALYKQAGQKLLKTCVGGLWLG